VFVHLPKTSDLERACQKTLAAVEKSVEEILIDLMAEKVMYAGAQASSMRGLQYPH
jgi:exonuclease VII small subunit